MALVEPLPADPVTALTTISSWKDDIDALEHETVLRARKAGVSWQEIADALGTSRQAAWERFTRPTRNALAATAAKSNLTDDQALALAVAEVKDARTRRRS